MTITTGFAKMRAMHRRTRTHNLTEMRKHHRGAPGIKSHAMHTKCTQVDESWKTHKTRDSEDSEAQAAFCLAGGGAKSLGHLLENLLPNLPPCRPIAKQRKIACLRTQGRAGPALSLAMMSYGSRSKWINSIAKMRTPRELGVTVVREHKEF